MSARECCVGCIFVLGKYLGSDIVSCIAIPPAILCEIILTLAWLFYGGLSYSIIIYDG